MLKKGPEKFTVHQETGKIPVVTIEADASFSAYGIERGKRSLLLGPFKTDARILTARIPKGIKQVEVATAKSTFWQYYVDMRSDGKEYPDPTPVEVPVDCRQPPSLREEMRRFIREEFSRNAEQTGQETFEDSDDFDIEGEDDFVSPYEMVDMIDEEPLEREEDQGSADRVADSEDSEDPHPTPPPAGGSGAATPPAAGGQQEVDASDTPTAAHNPS